MQKFYFNVHWFACLPICLPNGSVSVMENFNERVQSNVGILLIKHKLLSLHVFSGRPDFWIGLTQFRFIDGRAFTYNVEDQQGNCVAIVKKSDSGKNVRKVQNCDSVHPFICMASVEHIDYIGKYHNRVM